MIVKTAISLIVTLTTTALLQDALPCPGNICLKPDGDVVYEGYSEGSNRYNTNFTSFTTELPSEIHLDRTAKIPFGHDGVFSFSECQCQSNYCMRKCCSLNSTMDVHTGRCMDDETVTVKGRKRRELSLYLGEDSLPCLGTCPAGKELHLAPFSGGMHFILMYGYLCTIHGHDLNCHIPDEFCIDYVTSPWGLAVASCRNATKTPSLKYRWKFLAGNVPIMHLVLNVNSVISILSLTVTFLVYSYFRELRNMHGKCLLCHVGSFIVHHVLLISREHRDDAEYMVTDWICLSLDMANFYFYLAPFSWMNAICFDIFMSFMRLRPRHVNNREAERMKFAFHSLYSWTTPLLAYITILIIDLRSSVNGIHGFYYNHNLDIRWCSLGGRLTSKYKRYPMSVYMVISVVLFVTTAIKIYRINASTSILRLEERVQGRDENNNKHSFKIYAKLLVVMGLLSWVMEPISYVAWKGNTAFGVAAEFFRNLQGLLISVFLLWNDKVINLLREKVLKSRARIIQHCFPRPQNVEPLSPPELSSQASQNPSSSVFTVTTCQGSQGSISESGHMVSENRENLRDFNVLTGKPVEDTPSPSLGGSSCPYLIPVVDTNVQLPFSTASSRHETSHL